MANVTQNVPLEMTRGDTFSLAFSTDLENDLDEVEFSIKTSYDAVAYTVHVTLTSPGASGGVTKEDDGVYVVRVAPAATVNLTPGPYVYDLQVTYGSDIFTPLRGSFRIGPDVTRPSA